MHRWLIAGLLILMVTGCEGNISGKVFLDKNGNNLRDEGEPGLSKVLYTVTLDGANYKSGETDENGNFAVPKDGDRSGDYCIKVADSASQYFEESPGIVSDSVAKTMESGTDTQAPTTIKKCFSNTDESCPSGKICRNGLCSSICSTDSKCASNETCSDGACVTMCNKNKDCPSGQTCSSRTCSSGNGTASPSTPLPAAKPLQNCARLQGYSAKANIDVPVAVDMVATLNVVPIPGDKTVKAGEEFSIDIFYPRSCKLLDLKLPDVLIPTGGHVLENNSVDLSALQPSKQAIDSYSLSIDSLYSVSIPLKASSDISGTEETVTIRPKVVCPNNLVSPVSELKEQKIIIKKERKIDYGYKVEGEPEVNKPLTLKLNIKNNGVSDYQDGGSITVDLPQMIVLAVEAMPACSFTYQKVKCELSEIKSHKESLITIKFKLIEKSVKATITLDLPDQDPVVETLPIDVPQP